jgi:hypothetical protein
MPQQSARRKAKHFRHLCQLRIDGAGPLADRHRDVRNFCQRNRANCRSLVQAEPDIGQHDDDQRRNVEQQDQPGVEQPVGNAAHA